MLEACVEDEMEENFPASSLSLLSPSACLTVPTIEKPHSQRLVRIGVRPSSLPHLTAHTIDHYTHATMEPITNPRPACGTAIWKADLSGLSNVHQVADLTELSDLACGMSNKGKLLLLAINHDTARRPSFTGVSTCFDFLGRCDLIPFLLSTVENIGILTVMAN